jgi:transcriptional regulator with XRE-family HTH domain
MGSVARWRSERLAEKLLHVRTTLGLSQNGMLRRLGFADEMLQARISSYELGTREPPLPVLLAYARAANVYVDALVDDDMDLPERLPSAKKSEGTKRVPAPRGKRR